MRMQNQIGLKIKKHVLHVNGEKFPIEPPNYPGVDNSKVIITFPDLVYELRYLSDQEIARRKFRRLRRRLEKKCERQLLRAEKPRRFLWFRF